ALVSRMPKRNGWTIAEHVGDATPDRTQRLLNRAVWDTEGVASQVRRYAVAGLDTAAGRRRRRGLAVGALDETGQQKQGTATSGVKRQYMGCAGRVSNGINTVHLAYVRERTGHALIAARQWIPAEQVTDPDTAARTGLPPGLGFRTKGQLAIDLCTHAYADELTFDVICGDEVYGNCTELRDFLEQRGQAYVLRVASTFMIQTPSGDRLTYTQAVDLLVGGAGRGWQVRSAGTGSKGHRWYAWAWIATASPRHHLLVRRHLATGELAFHYCYVPEGQPAVVSRLILAAGLRWPVEECFEFGKDHLGLDQCQARLHDAIARHTVLVMAALAVCAVTAAELRHRTDSQAPPPTTPDQPPPAEPGLIPLTVPEIGRLLADALHRPQPPDHAIDWLTWRRRHQARARWHHQRTRLNREYALVN
ncbi:IS701 family transposase, partial [Micromonospora sp. LOL_023]|uniref:IS701 family transposase n=1 Tax=Micromonospora sp. LOL_023 TaxID=3345418 RepID=UPI003A8B2961